MIVSELETNFRYKITGPESPTPPVMQPPVESV